MFGFYTNARTPRLMRVCGVDDAGRGSVIGPLVIGGVAMERSKLRRLARTGVKDSKVLSAQRREELYVEIIEEADAWTAASIRPSVIDTNVRSHMLNVVEARYMARVISKMIPDTAYIDACDVNAARFGKSVSSMLSGSRPAKVKSYHKADSRFVIVSAASIIAKVTRDRAIARIRRQHNVGSGYPSDPTCVAFLKKHARTAKAPPKFARASWETVSRIYGLPSASLRRQGRGRGRMARGQRTL